MSIKISYQDTVSKLKELPPTLKELKTIINKSFSELSNCKYSLSYLDEDGDKILIREQSEYDILYSEVKSHPRTYKIFVTKSEGSVFNPDESFEQVLFPSKEEAAKKEIEEVKVEEAEPKNQDVKEVKNGEPERSQSQKPEIEPKIRTFRVTKRLINEDYKSEEEKAELENKLADLNEKLSSEDKEWVANKLNKSQHKDQNRDWLYVAININRRLLKKGDDIPEHKKTVMQERLQKAMERLDEEQKQQLLKMMTLLKERLESLKERENDPKKIVQRFVSLWRKIETGKADEKLKERFATLGKTFDSNLKKSAEERIEAVKARIAMKKQVAVNRDQQIPQLLKVFREKYNALNQQDKKSMNDKLDGILGKLSQTLEMKMVDKEARMELRKKFKNAKIAESKQKAVSEELN